MSVFHTILKFVEMSTIRALSVELGIIFTSVILYFNTTFCGFVFDDFSAVLNNKDLDVNATWSNLLWNDYWGTPMHLERSHKSYRPLTVLTFKLNNLMFGLEASSFHVVNIVLHISVCVLYYWMCCVTCEKCSKHDSAIKFEQRTKLEKNQTNVILNSNNSKKSEKWQSVAYVATALFTVHPVHTEAAAGVVGRAELLSAVFMLLTFLYFAKFKPLYFLLALLFFICAIASKEQGITVLAICVVYDFFVAHKLSPLEFLSLRKTSTIYVGLRSAIFCFIACVILYWRVSIMGDSLPSFVKFDNPAALSETPTRQLTYNYLLAINAWILVNPSDLLCDWSMGTVPLVNDWTDVRNILTAIFWLLLLSLSWIAVSKKDSNSKMILMGLSFIVFPFLPASNLFFPVGFVVAERILYLPSMGYCLIMAVGFVKLQNNSKNKLFIYYAFAILCVCFATKTILRNLQWQSDYTLFQSGLQVTKNNAKIWNNVGHSIEIKQPEMALLYFTEAAKIQPDDIGSHMNVGRIKKRLGLYEDAEKAYRKAKDQLPKHVPGKMITAKIAPDDLQLFVHLGNLMKMNKSRWEEADALYKEALSMRNDFADGYINRGEILMLMERYNEAVDCYKNALKYTHHIDDMYFNLGVIHSQMGNITGAIEYYTYAIQVNAYHIKALYNSAVIFEETGNKDLINRAKIRVERILEIEPENYLALSLLGSIYLDYGDEETATNFWQKVLTIHPDDKSALYNMAFMFSKKDDTEECVRYIETLLTYHPTHIKGLTLYGQTLLNKKKNTKAAAEAFHRIIEADPKNIQARHNYCVCILEEGRLRDAEKCMHDVYLLAPEAKYVADNLAIIRKHIAEREHMNIEKVSDFTTDNKNPSLSNQNQPKSDDEDNDRSSEEEEFIFVEPKIVKSKMTTLDKAHQILTNTKNAAKLVNGKENEDKSIHLDNALRKAHDAVKQLNEMNNKLDNKKEQQCSKLSDKNNEEINNLKEKALNYLDELEAELF
uniref:protein O-mannosyl-transferase TMTC3-like isoform X1 n=2 Tax=Styela clava TaxID=7725 RepID=UPI00193AC3D7|nr:protein O-mannosyl-transferase TMTC3-like isoform X1 [Styela clava]